MVAILNAVVTTAGTVVGSPFQLRDPAGLNPVMAAQCTFTYGSGGTSVGVFVQTSYDGGTTWCDVIAFATLTTSSARTLASVVQAAATSAAATDGTLTQATNATGPFGAWWRVKFISVGTYATNTTLRVDVFTNIGLVPAGVGAGE